MAKHIDTAAILRRTFALLRANAFPALAGFVALAVPMIAIDAFVNPNDSRLSWVVSPVAMFAQFIVTASALRRAGLMRAEGKAGRAATYVLLLILSGLAAVIGFLLLVLPGIYLASRWSAAVPLVIAEGASLSDALGQSWERTRGIVVPISATLVLINVWTAGAFVLLFTLYSNDAPAPLPIAIAVNLLTYAPQVLTWHCAVAIYALTRRVEPDLEKVFA